MLPTTLVVIAVAIAAQGRLIDQVPSLPYYPLRNTVEEVRSDVVICESAGTNLRFWQSYVATRFARGSAWEAPEYTARCAMYLKGRRDRETEQIGRALTADPNLGPTAQRDLDVRHCRRALAFAAPEPISIPAFEAAVQASSPLSGEERERFAYRCVSYSLGYRPGALAVPAHGPTQDQGTVWADTWHLIDFAQDQTGAVFVGVRDMRSRGATVTVKMLSVFNRARGPARSYDQAVLPVEVDCSRQTIRQAGPERSRLGRGADDEVQAEWFPTSRPATNSILGTLVAAVCGGRALGERAFHPYSYAMVGFRRRER